MKKIITMLLCVLLISATIVPISAANTSDSKITKFDLSYFYYREVSARSKTNTTPLYFYYTIGKHNSVQVQALGSTTADTGTTDNLTLDNGKHVKRVTCTKGIQYSVRSYIYESGYRYARLGLSTNWLEGDTISGVWSPDSTGTYTVARY